MIWVQSRRELRHAQKCKGLPSPDHKEFSDFGNMSCHLSRCDIGDSSRRWDVKGGDLKIFKGNFSSDYPDSMNEGLGLLGRMLMAGCTGP